MGTIYSQDPVAIAQKKYNDQVKALRQSECNRKLKEEETRKEKNVNNLVTLLLQYVLNTKDDCVNFTLETGNRSKFLHHTRYDNYVNGYRNGKQDHDIDKRAVKIMLTHHNIKIGINNEQHLKNLNCFNQKEKDFIISTYYQKW
jgi:hypothetical protein